MTAPPLRAPVTSALVDMLAATTRHPAGDGDASFTGDEHPYTVVDALPGGVPGGHVGAPDTVADVVWQVTAVGETRAQAEGLMDRARTAILARDDSGAYVNALDALPTVVVARRWDGDGGLVVDAGVVNVSERFRFTIRATSVGTPPVP